MSKKHEGRVALVTGASRGIGRAVCVELARTGYHILVNYKSDRNSAIKTLEMVKAEGADGRIMQFDVSDAKETEAAIKDIFSRYASVEVLVNNAGITADSLFIMMSRKNWDSVIRTTLDGFFNVTRPVLEEMVLQKRGNIVSISSVSAIMANRGQANYAAAKAGLIGASRSIASEVARLGIRVNIVAPGLIDTDMTRDLPLNNIKQIIPMARIGKPEEVAKVVRFLCSDDASYITGQVIAVNGGMV